MKRRNSVACLFDESDLTVYEVGTLRNTCVLRAMANEGDNKREMGGGECKKGEMLAGGKKRESHGVRFYVASWCLTGHFVTRSAK